MSKGIIVAENYQDAKYEHDLLYFNDDILEELYRISSKGNFPVIKKIVADSYGDAMIKKNEIKSLISELKKLFSNEKTNTNTKKILKKLKIICNDALKQKKQIFFIAD